MGLRNFRESTNRESRSLIGCHDFPTGHASILRFGLSQNLCQTLFTSKKLIVSVNPRFSVVDGPFFDPPVRFRTEKNDSDVTIPALGLSASLPARAHPVYASSSWRKEHLEKIRR